MGDTRIAAVGSGQAVPSGPVAPAAPVAQPPANVPAKFWNPTTKTVDHEKLYQSYSELERKLSAGGTPAPAAPAAPAGNAPATPAAPAAPADPAKPGNPLEVKAPEIPKGFATPAEMEGWTKEFMESGALSEASYKALETKGMPKAMVDAYIAGQHALVQQARSQAFALTGGEEKYVEMAKWASTNVPEAEREVFNRAVNSGNAAERDAAILGLHARFVAANSNAPGGLVRGDSTSGMPGGEAPFANSAEMQAAMRDKRYQTDPAFRDSVARRVAAMK